MTSVPAILREMATVALTIPGIKSAMYPAKPNITDTNLPVLAFFWGGDEDTRIEPSGVTSGDMWLPTFKAQLYASSLRGDVVQEITAGDGLVTAIVDFYNRPIKEWSSALHGDVHRIQCVRVRPSAILEWPEGTRYYGAEFIFECKFHRRREA